MKIDVYNNDISGALKRLKRKLQKEGIFNELRSRTAYEKPSEKRRREKAEAIRRARKAGAARHGK